MGVVFLGTEVTYPHPWGSAPRRYAMAVTPKHCVVCGQGSTREEWIKKSKDGKYVACDSHSDAEIEKAVAALPKAKSAS